VLLLAGIAVYIQPALVIVRKGVEAASTLVVGLVIFAMEPAQAIIVPVITLHQGETWLLLGKTYHSTSNSTSPATATATATAVSLVTK